jgi:putative ABC transport system permease protein
MDYARILRISVESLTVHKLRTTLTMLGVIFGVAAVIAMLSIGEGAKREALEQISILGIKNIIVSARVPDEEIGSQGGLQRSPGLSLEDGRNIARVSDAVINVVPQRFEAISRIFYGSAESSARVVATIPDFVLSSSIEVENGRFITPLDNESFAQVCILGAKAKRNLFAFEDPIGKSVRIGDWNFVVVGVMADKYIARGKVEGFELKNFNEDVYIPLSTAMKKIDRVPQAGEKGFSFRWSSSDTEEEQKYRTPAIDQLTVTVSDLEMVAPITKLIQRMLNRRHYGVNDYEIVVPESLLRQTQKTQSIFNIVMGTIAGISLLVGGIGIMNIMLATVLERTREIGVRRAVGAKQSDIARQFLIEAVTICLIGCAAGIILGVTLARIIAYYAEWPTIVTVFSIVLAAGVSTGVGVIFGFYPAVKAARLDVIESLRYE